MLDVLMQTVTVYIPTMALGIFLAAKLQGIGLNRRQLAMSGLLLGLLVMVFRLLPISFGWHIPAVTLGSVITLRLLGKGRWSMAVLSVLCVQLLGMVGEALVTFPVITFLGLQASDTLANPALFAMAGWLANVPLLVVWAGMHLYQRYRRETV